MEEDQWDRWKGGVTFNRDWKLKWEKEDFPIYEKEEDDEEEKSTSQWRKSLKNNFKNEEKQDSQPIKYFCNIHKYLREFFAKSLKSVEKWNNN